MREKTQRNRNTRRNISVGLRVRRCIQCTIKSTRSNWSDKKENKWTEISRMNKNRNGKKMPKKHVIWYRCKQNEIKLIYFGRTTTEINTSKLISHVLFGSSACKWRQFLSDCLAAVSWCMRYVTSTELTPAKHPSDRTLIWFHSYHSFRLHRPSEFVILHCSFNAKRSFYTIYIAMQ